MEYSKAIVRLLSPSYQQCVSGHPEHQFLNFSKAMEQHENYRKLLEDLGLELIVLNGDELYPDCCFVEDNAVIYGENAVITRMGVESRRGEENAITEILYEYKNIQFIENQGTLEGGDIIHINDQNLLICGNSQRTNSNGINQLAKKLNCDVKIIQDEKIIHLKSYVTYLGGGTILTTNKYKNHPSLVGFEKLAVNQNEMYAANSLNINETVIIPKGFPATKDLLGSNGFKVEILDMSEFQKCEGALTCLSLPF